MTSISGTYEYLNNRKFNERLINELVDEVLIPLGGFKIFIILPLVALPLLIVLSSRLEASLFRRGG